jgi:hypothetical protein
MDLRTLAVYASVCQKTLRAWIRDVDDPLPAYQRGNKFYVNRVEYDRWLRKHPAMTDGAIDQLVEEVVSEVRT